MVAFDRPSSVERRCRTRNIREMDPALEQMAHALVESGEYRVIRRLKPRTEYHPPDDNPKLIAAVVDVETTGIDPERDKIIELGMCVFEYGRQDGRIYRVIGSWNWLEDPGISSSRKDRRVCMFASADVGFPLGYG
jgi:DNA polymerase-3 subunit epsilon